jgi:hypothetical protein
MRPSLRFASSVVAALTVCLGAPAAGAQSPAFLFSVAPRSDTGTPVNFAYADLGFGERVMRGVGVDRFEQRVGAQLAFTARVALLVSGGYASAGNGGSSAVAARAEVLTNLLSTRRPAVLALSVGAGREYQGAGIVTGRVVAGYLGTRWDAISNLRLERAVSKSRDGERRDGLDVITTFGVARRVLPSLRVGVEAIAEDLEGLIDSEEAEGGAKLMLGPTLRLAPASSRWNALIGGGPVLRLSRSTASSPVPAAARDIPTRDGFALRSAIAYRW